MWPGDRCWPPYQELSEIAGSCWFISATRALAGGGSMGPRSAKSCCWLGDVMSSTARRCGGRSSRARSRRASLWSTQHAAVASSLWSANDFTLPARKECVASCAWKNRLRSQGRRGFELYTKVARGKAAASHSTSKVSPSQNASCFEKNARSCRRLAADQVAESCSVRMPKFCNSSHQLRVPVLLGPMKKTLCASEAAMLRFARGDVRRARVEYPEGTLDEAFVSKSPPPYTSRLPLTSLA